MYVLVILRILFYCLDSKLQEISEHYIKVGLL